MPYTSGPSSRSEPFDASEQYRGKGHRACRNTSSRSCSSECLYTKMVFQCLDFSYTQLKQSSEGGTDVKIDNYPQDDHYQR